MVAALSWSFSFFPSLFVFVFIVFFSLRLFSLLSLLYFLPHAPTTFAISFMSRSPPRFHLSLLFFLCFPIHRPPVALFLRPHNILASLLYSLSSTSSFSLFDLKTQGQIVGSGGSLRRQSTSEEVFGICYHMLSVFFTETRQRPVILAQIISLLSSSFSTTKKYTMKKNAFGRIGSCGVALL